jgi:hypothetical protein
MRKPFQMYSHIDDLKIIQLKSSLYPIPFVGVINHTICSGVITSSKINRLRKDGMSLKYFRNNYILSSDMKKICKQPLTIEYKSAPHALNAGRASDGKHFFWTNVSPQLLSKKFIKSVDIGRSAIAPIGRKHNLSD